MNYSQHFTEIQKNRILPQGICHVALCPTMDIIAVGIGACGSLDQINPHSSAAMNSPTQSKSNSSSMIVVYRTISWQKMFSISQSDLASASFEVKDELDDLRATNEYDEEGEQRDNSTVEIGGTNLTWSPDGRILAVALTNGVMLFYDIELCTVPGMTPTPIYSLPCLPLVMPREIEKIFSSDNSDKMNPSKSSRSLSPILTRSMTAARRKRLMRMAGKTPLDNELEYDRPNAIICPQPLPTQPSRHDTIHNIKTVSWQRICQRHNAEWYFRKEYLDRSAHFLPPCHYTLEEVHGIRIGADDSLMLMNKSKSFHTDAESSISDGMQHIPRATNALSILVTLGDDGLVLYLNGRYRILSVSFESMISGIQENVVGDLQLVSTSDAHLLTSYKSRDSLRYHLYSFPTLVDHRYNLQFITSSYVSIRHHLSTIKHGMEESQTAWCASLRQLDIKFDQLLVLLKKYNVIQENSHNQEELMRNELLGYILGGHSSRSSDSSNALDQFFTHPMMNDQLLVRLFRSVEANVAGVESLFRKKILAPCRSLVFDAEELHGLVKAMNLERKYEDADFMSTFHMEDELLGSLPALMDDETCDRLCQSAKIMYMVAEQCVYQIVEIRYRLDCMTKWVRATASQVKARGTAADSAQRQNARKRRIPDYIVQNVAQFLSVPLKTSPEQLSQKRGLTESMLGILLLDYFVKDRVYFERRPDRLIPPGLNNSPLDANDYSFIETPSLKEALAVSKDIASELFHEPRKVMNSMVNRVELVVEEVENQSNSISATHSRFIEDITHQSSLDDEGRYPHDNSSFDKKMQWIIIANTCSSKHETGQIIQITAIPLSATKTQFLYETAFIQLPSDCVVANMQFYGDDGNSTLISESSPTFEEGRQSLGLLLHRKMDDDKELEELWLFEYDSITFLKVKEPVGSNGEIIVRRFDHSIDTIQKLAPRDVDGIEYKWRRTKFVDKGHISSSEMVMSGSRGIAALWSRSEKSIDIYDLEEDQDLNQDDDSND